MEGFLRYRIGGLVFWRGLYMEGLIFGILQYELATGYPPGSCQWFYATLSEKTYKSRKKSQAPSPYNYWDLF